MFENIKSKKSPIGIEFMKRGLLTEGQVSRVLEYQKEHKELKFAEIVDILDMCDKSDLLDVLSYKIQVTGVMLDGELKINPDNKLEYTIDTKEVASCMTFRNYLNNLIKKVYNKGE